MPKLSINLVTWNGDRFIEDCLYSLLNQTYKDFSIIIIDNGSTDRTLEIVNERFPHLSVIRHKENIGFCRAHNQAIHWSKSDYVLCLNQDIILEPDFLEKMVQFMDKTPLCASLTGKVLRKQENEKTKYIDTLGLKIQKNFSVVEIGAGEQDANQYDSIKEVFGISGAVPMYRRKALEEIIYKQEYFDEDFFSYKEDIDLAFRFRCANWQSFYNPLAVAYHDRSVGAEKEKLSNFQIIKNRRKKSKFANRLSYRNHLFFIYKNIPSFKLKIFWPVFWYEFLKFFYILIFEFKTIGAWTTFFRLKPVLKAKRQVIQKNKRVSDDELLKWINLED
jgi:GT2 family glycosyltransferase